MQKIVIWKMLNEMKEIRFILRLFVAIVHVCSTFNCEKRCCYHCSTKKKKSSITFDRIILIFHSIFPNKKIQIISHKYLFEYYKK